MRYHKKFRIVKNTYNLGLWIIKDVQGRITVNLWKIRIQL